MNAAQVRARTLSFISEQTSAGYESGTTLGARNFDSLDIVELELAIEAEWSILVPDELWNHDTTVDQVLADVVRIVCSVLLSEVKPGDVLVADVMLAQRANGGA